MHQRLTGKMSTANTSPVLRLCWSRCGKTGLPPAMQRKLLLLAGSRQALKVNQTRQAGHHVMAVVLDKQLAMLLAIPHLRRTAVECIRRSEAAAVLTWRSRLRPWNLSPPPQMQVSLSTVSGSTAFPTISSKIFNR